MLLVIQTVAVLAIAILAALGIVGFYRWNEKRKQKCSPLSGKPLLRSPGESLKIKIDEIQSDLDLEFLYILVLPIVAFLFYLLEIRSISGTTKTANQATVVVITAVIVIRALMKITKLLKKRDRFRLGYECELATGQQLNQLLVNGCKVFHDIVFDNFNIDHVVVGSAGVFGIETKGRRKPVTDNGNVDARVIYDGKSLQFAGWKPTTEPIEQSIRNAKWLAKQLSESTGEKVTVKPVVALPGWFVDIRIKSPKVFVMTPMNAYFLNQLAIPSDDSILSDQQVKQIAYQLERMCGKVVSLDKTPPSRKFAS